MQLIICVSNRWCTKTKVFRFFCYILFILLFWGCYSANHLQGSLKRKGLHGKTVSGLSLFNSKIIIDEQPRKNKHVSFIHLLYDNDSLVYVIIGKKNIRNKSNRVFEYLPFAGGNLLASDNLMKYQHIDSVFFMGDTCLIKNTVLGLNPMKEQEIEVVYYTLYFFDAKTVYRSQYTWHKNTDSVPVGIIDFLHKWNSEKGVKEKNVQIPYINETKEQAQLFFLGTYF